MKAIGEAFQDVLAALDRLEIPYAIGGSVASAVRGNYRYTNDVDILVGISPDVVSEFVEALGPDFHADAESMRRAFRLGRLCNIISVKTAFKLISSRQATMSSPFRS